MTTESKEVVILLGSPGCGKSSWCLFMAPNHVRVSQDDQGPTGHRELFKAALKDGSSIVVDRMNFNLEQREQYTVPARKLGYKIRYIWFKRDFNRCFGQMLGRKGHPTISEGDYQTMCKAISFYFKHFEEPAPEEYDSIEVIE